MKLSFARHPTAVRRAAFLVMFLFLLSQMLIGPVSAKAASKIDEFISDSRWSNGQSWGEGQTPKLPGYSCFGCYAYAHDFMVYVYNKGLTSSIADNAVGSETNSAANIHAGDIIYVSQIYKYQTDHQPAGLASTNHWFCVIENNNGTLKTAEGNNTNAATGQVQTRVTSNGYKISNGKLIKNDNWYGGEYTGYVVYHFTASNADTTPPTISQVNISDLSSTGYTVSCTVSDNVGVTYVSFPSWTIQNGQDDLLWDDRAKVNVNSGANISKTISFRVNTSDHNNETDCDYLTHIYAYDAAGNAAATNQNAFPVLYVHVPAPAYKLTVKGNLDGVTDTSTAGYGTFDVYINGSPDAAACTSYSKLWPTGTTYEIRNVQPLDGKSYDASASSGLSGKIGTKEAVAILSFASDGIATPEWQTGNALPGNLNPALLDIEYQHTYRQSARTSPGSSWTLVETGAVQYETDGSPYNSDDPLPTSELRRLVGHYYFHWCGDPNDRNRANYFRRPGVLDTYHTIPMDHVQYFSIRTTAQDGDRTYYSFNNVGNGTLATCPDGCRYYYEGNVYQNYKTYQINTYQMVGDWTESLDTAAYSYIVRWRLKDPPASFMTLPTGLKTIGSEAFSNCGTEAVYIPSGCTAIESRAFANNDQLQQIYIPASVTSIDPSAFLNCPHLAIYAPEDSFAARFAQLYSIPFVAE